MILSILYKSDPSQVRLLMIDPKMLELSTYSDIPHLIAPVVTDHARGGPRVELVRGRNGPAAIGC